jgi:hypothetical protein
MTKNRPFALTLCAAHLLFGAHVALAAQPPPPPLPYVPSGSPAPTPPANAPTPPATTTTPASSDTITAAGADTEEDVKRPSLGLSPDAPQVGALPGGVMPSFGTLPAGIQDWRFDFHGLASLPLRAGINTRDNPTPDQHKTVLHAPPGVPGYLGTFSYTGIVPEPWVQLNFSYGNPLVTMTVILAARSVTAGAAFFDPPSQLGINDAFLTFRVLDRGTFRVKLDIGSYRNRYGTMGRYDTGRYGTPAMATISGTGETATASASFGDFTLVAEQGFSGQHAKAPTGLAPAMWNDFADPNVGSSFVGHGHAGVLYKDLAQLSLHYFSAWSQDDRATPNQQPDGSINVGGVEGRLTAGRFGHLYLGGSQTTARHARTVSGVLRVLNTRGGPGLITEYLGPNSGGNGKLTTVAAQYDLSLGTLLRHPVRFYGNGPDLFVSAFGMLTRVASEDPAFDGEDKLKYGLETTYSMLSWLSVSGRYDRVIPRVGDNFTSFAVLSPRLIFRSNWNAQDQIVLQYSHYLYGSQVVVRSGVPPIDDPTIQPDRHVVSLSGTMWW